MYSKKIQVLGMSCESCQKKISEKLNSLSDITAEVDLSASAVVITSSKKIDIEFLNHALKEIGNYQLKDKNDVSNDFIPPQNRISPSSVYYCPMECEGEKVYFKQGERCPVCNMYLVPIEEKNQSEKDVKIHVHAEGKDGYYCPMYCEGDKIYEKNVGCPICGMDLVKIPTKENSSHDEHLSQLKRKFYVSVIFSSVVFVLSMGGMFFHFEKHVEQFKGYLELVLSLPVIFYSGWFLLKRGWISFKTWNLNMFSLISLGVVTSFVFSLVSLFFPQIIPSILLKHHTPLYFESVCVIITLVILGQMMEAKAYQKTGNAIKELMKLAPSKAIIVVNGQNDIVVDISEVKKGNLLRIKSGERIPVDGIIVSGASAIDESMITGESFPVEKKIKDKVIAGTINGSGSFIMKAEKVGNQTLLHQIITMVTEASRTKPPIQKMVDKIAKIFVPIVILISVVTFCCWYLFTGQFNLALTNSISVLIVACPCTLGLATPMSLMVGIGKGARNGILIKNAEVLEAMNQLNVLIIDKTGTITEGKPHLEKIELFGNLSKDRVLFLAGCLSQNSGHPLSESILNQIDKNNIKLSQISHFKNIIGKGLKGTIENQEVILGNETLIEESNIVIDENQKEKIQLIKKEGYTLSYLVENENLLAIFCFKDRIKSEAKKAIDFFKNQKVDVKMMSGDNEIVSQSVAHSVGINQYKAHCLPEDKILEVKRLQQEGKIVAMAGDGINDAPALAQANIGIAMGTGVDIAIDCSKITLLKGNINALIKAKILSSQLLKNIHSNLFFALIYNVIGIPIAAGILYPIFGILLNPMLAALAMSLSSLSVIINSLRLNSQPMNLKTKKT